MKTIQIKFNPLFALLLVGSIFTSCSSDDDTLDDTGTNPPQENNQAILLDCDSFQANNADAILLLEDLNDEVDYIINCVTVVQVDLKIEPGVVIQFTDGAGMKIRESGSLNAVGTENKPIAFSSAAQVKGAWKGIISDSEKIKNRFDYVTIEYAGAGNLGAATQLGSLIFTPNAYYRLNNVTIRNGLNYGLFSNNYDYDAEINDCIITNCDVPMFVDTNILSTISGGDFTGNTTDVIRLNGGSTGTVDASHTWKDLGIPYRVAEDIIIKDGAKLTLEPGVILEFEDTKGMTIDKLFDEGSALIAVGTPTNPIVFTGVTKSPGAWKSIFCYRSTSVQNKMENVLIEYAGGAGADGAIEFWTEPVLNVSSSTFKDIAACAVFNHGDEDNPNFSESNNTTDNVSGGYICHD
ncbi:hypothetical protein ACFQ3R_04430 [Mesonia ostreae]|uniref:Uncharacterized protein n=1 Tax=Mesonia ostreae TaxID=861110 RepID=A0ABU2KIR5_9FLAO|nr:hypothetical protein [Mesonia ostreae]MDT0294603.1 hypothetical protein [Mesonia ostreae]